MNSYVSPGMCATKRPPAICTAAGKAVGYDRLYQEISDFARIFNVEDRGQALIADFKNVKPTCAEFGKSKKISLRLLVLQRLAFGRCLCRRQNSASGFIASVLGGHNAITSETEWPTVSWESIIAANPDVIVVASTTVTAGRWIRPRRRSNSSAIPPSASWRR